MSIIVLLRTAILMSFVAASAVASEQSSEGTVPFAIDSRIVPARPWKYLVVHHSASESGSVESIDAYHKTRRDSNGDPWRGIGYHFVIGNGSGMADGQVSPTFRWRKQIEGAHAGSKDYNERGIGICLIGDFERAKPSDAQLSALSELMLTLQKEHDITPTGVLAHRDIRQTACPGRLFPRAQFPLLGMTHPTRKTMAVPTRSAMTAHPAKRDHESVVVAGAVKIANQRLSWKESR